MPATTDRFQPLRNLLTAVLALGIAASTADLLLIAHHEDTVQWIPIALGGIGLGAVAWCATAGSPGSVRTLRAIMLAFIVAGIAGVVLHARGNMEFQLEIDATQHAWDLFRKVMRAKAPPALAPGVMIQLGLLGLISTVRHPAFDIDRSS